MRARAVEKKSHPSHSFKYLVSCLSHGFEVLGRKQEADHNHAHKGRDKYVLLKLQESVHASTTRQTMSRGRYRGHRT
jgi:hypothetical protein